MFFIHFFEPSTKRMIQNLEDGVTTVVVFLDENKKRNKKVNPLKIDEHSRLATIVYELCTKRELIPKSKNIRTCQEFLYDRFKETIEQYLKKNVLPVFNDINKDTLLSEVVQRWRNHQLVVPYMRKVYDYLDRFYTKNQSKASLTIVGLVAFRDIVFSSIKKELSSSLLKQIERERTGEPVDPMAMKDCVNLFVEMGLKNEGRENLEVYKVDLEEKLLQDTAEFYKTQSEKWVRENDAPNLMMIIDKRLVEEDKRAHAYLHEHTWERLIAKCEEEMILKNKNTIMFMENSGFVPLMRELNDKKEHLGRMFKLLKRVNTHIEMSDLFCKFAREEAMEVVKRHEQVTEQLKPENVFSFIDNILSIHEKHLSLVQNEFQNDSNFQRALQGAFTTVANCEVNKFDKKSEGNEIKAEKENNNENKPNEKNSMVEYLSNFCDYVIRNKEKFGDEGLEFHFERFVKFFGYVQDKDLFMEFYRRFLSKRLLVVNARATDEDEKVPIQKMKVKQGSAFTIKVEGMIKDKATSLDLTKDFKSFITKKNKEEKKEDEKEGIDFHPVVLTLSFWPPMKTDETKVPNEMQTCLNSFKTYYEQKNASRTLSWVHTLGTCNVTSCYKGGEWTINCTAIQAMMLLQFNDKASNTMGDVQKNLNISNISDVRKNLYALAFQTSSSIPQKKTEFLLKKSGNVEKIDSTDVYEVNEGFVSKSSKIKVTAIMLKISKKERTSVKDRCIEDRNFVVDACIVRNMKAKKTMEHKDLIVEVTKQLMNLFNPEQILIRRRIEDLITREFMRRDEENNKVYHYIA